MYNIINYRKHRNTNTKLHYYTNAQIRKLKIIKYIDTQLHNCTNT